MFDKDLASKALKELLPKEWGYTWEIDRELAGNSSAQICRITLRRVELGQGAMPPDAPPPGGYVLRVARRRDGEFSDGNRHRYAQGRNTEIGSHIPNLHGQATVIDTEGQTVDCMLYEVAGGDDEGHVLLAASLKRPEEVARVASQVLLDLLRYWRDGDPGGEINPASLLNKWIKDFGDLRSWLKSELNGESSFSLAGSVLIDPFELFEHARTMPQRCVMGTIHGDLHPGNILYNSGGADAAASYSLIDFAYTREAPLGFDAGFFLVGLFVELCRRSAISHRFQNGEPAIRALLAIVQDSLDDLPLEVRHLAGIIRDTQRALRRARSADPQKNTLEIQHTLGLIGGGISWASFSRDSDRRAAILWSAFYATQYLAKYDESQRDRLTNSLRLPMTPKATVAAGSAFREIRSRAMGFDGSRNPYVLVAGPLEKSDALSSLGRIGWSMVIDLDRTTKTSSLRESCEEVLRSKRNVQVIPASHDPSATSLALASLEQSANREYFQHACAWIEAADPSVYEPGGAELWRRKKKKVVERAVRVLNDAAPVDTIFRVVVLVGPRGDDKRLLNVMKYALDMLDEQFGGQIDVLLIGAHAPALHEQLAGRDKATAFPLGAAQFLEQLRDNLGAAPSTSLAELPALGGPLSIEEDDLRYVEADFDVLHSRIQAEAAAADAQNSEFWRGVPPSWTDLALESDVRRNLLAELRGRLERKLDAAPDALGPVEDRVEVLRHTPGAGGTTLALRAAWDLRTRVPVVVLRNQSRFTVERIHALYRLCRLPILLVAEESRLSVNAAIELVKECERQQDSIPLVALIVRRTLRLPAEPGVAVAEEVVDVGSISECPDHAESPLQLHEPMHEDEAEQFLERFRSRVPHVEDREKRVHELERLTHLRTLQMYRIPFFYGLVAFGPEFLRLEEYVRANLGQSDVTTQKVVAQIALLTRYTEGLEGRISDKAVQRLLGTAPSGDLLKFTDPVKAGPFRLVNVLNGRLRLIHEGFADEVMRVYLNIGAHNELEPRLERLTTEFIADLLRYVGHTKEVTDVLKALLCTRAAGEGRGDFSPLIETIRAIPQLGRTAAGRIFRELTERFPTEAHFFHHAARYSLYADDDVEQAEARISTAIDLSPEDAIHVHFRGVVHRSRIKRALGLRREELPDGTPAELLERVRSLYESARADFALARQQRPDDRHGYVTDLQMIVDVVERLAWASKSNDAAKLLSSADPVSEWVAEQLDDAEQLLDCLFEMDESFRSGNREYADALELHLSQLYGEFNDHVQDWQVRVVASDSRYLRRALCRAYLREHERRWSELPQPTLRYIRDLMAKSLVRNAHSEDYRLWFQATRRLPECEFDEVADTVERWAAEHPQSPDSLYYLMVVRFLAWYDHERDAKVDLASPQRRARDLFIARATHPLEHLGRLPNALALVADGDIRGLEPEQPETQRFKVNRDRLRRVNGRVRALGDRQGGYEVRIDDDDDAIATPQYVLARFDERYLPELQLTPGRDEERNVNFFVGFCARGLLAWDIREGHVADGNRTRRQDAAVEEPLVEEPAVAVPEISAAIQQSKLKRAKDLIEAYAQQWNYDEIDQPLSEIENGVLAAVGADSTVQLGFETFEDLANEVPQARIAKPEDSVPVFRGRSPRSDSLIASRASEFELAAGDVHAMKGELPNPFGFVHLRSGEVVYFNRLGIGAEVYDRLVPGDRVEVEYQRGDKSLIAKTIIPAPASSEGSTATGPVSEADPPSADPLTTPGEINTLIDFAARKLRHGPMLVSDLGNMLRGEFGAGFKASLNTGLVSFLQSFQDRFETYEEPEGSGRWHVVGLDTTTPATAPPTPDPSAASNHPRHPAHGKATRVHPAPKRRTGAPPTAHAEPQVAVVVPSHDEVIEVVSESVRCGPALLSSIGAVLMRRLGSGYKIRVGKRLGLYLTRSGFRVYEEPAESGKWYIRVANG